MLTLLPLVTCVFSSLGSGQQSAEDVSQFDSKFTSQTPVDSPDDSTLSESANQAFLVTFLAKCSCFVLPPQPARVYLCTFPRFGLKILLTEGGY